MAPQDPKCININFVDTFFRNMYLLLYLLIEIIHKYVVYVIYGKTFRDIFLFFSSLHMHSLRNKRDNAGVRRDLSLFETVHSAYPNVWSQCGFLPVCQQPNYGVQVFRIPPVQLRFNWFTRYEITENLNAELKSPLSDSSAGWFDQRSSSGWPSQCPDDQSKDEVRDDVRY